MLPQSYFKVQKSPNLIHNMLLAHYHASHTSPKLYKLEHPTPPHPTPRLHAPLALPHVPVPPRHGRPV